MAIHDYRFAKRTNQTMCDDGSTPPKSVQVKCGLFSGILMHKIA